MCIFFKYLDGSQCFVIIFFCVLYLSPVTGVIYTAAPTLMMMVAYMVMSLSTPLTPAIVFTSMRCELWCYAHTCWCFMCTRSITCFSYAILFVKQLL